MSQQRRAFLAAGAAALAAGPLLSACAPGGGAAPDRDGAPPGHEPEYLAVRDAVPHGAAPGVCARPLDGGSWSIVLANGDELFTALNDFAAAHDVRAASFTAIGALRELRLAWYDLSRRQFRVIPIPGQVEALSVIGDIGSVDGAPAVHTHLVVGREDGSAAGGHLLHAVASPTVEIFLRTYPADLPKSLDERSGLFLFDL